MANYKIKSLKFSDYAALEFMRRTGNSGDPTEFFIEHGTEKIPTQTAEQLAGQYAKEGAALGAIYPETVREMFELTHIAIPKEKWDSARVAGLDIPAKQESTSYDETGKESDETFMAYCRECCPNLCSDLFP